MSTELDFGLYCMLIGELVVLGQGSDRERRLEYWYITFDFTFKALKQPYCVGLEALRTIIVLSRVHGIIIS